MYGQGNYGPHFGQGPNTPMSTAYPQRPLVPPPPPPHSHQGHSVPPPPLNQQAPPAVPPHVGHPGPHIYHQHVPPVPSLSVHQGPPIQVPAGGMPNTGQSYLQIHGSAQLPLTYSNSQQNSQYHSHLGTQNMHHLPPPVPPPLGPHSEVLQAPPPPRVLPPPPPPPLPQGQTLYRSPVHPRPQQPGSVQGLQHIPPRPPTYSLSSPAHVGGFVPSTVGESHMPSMVLPPLPPPPPPPPPPSSPPPGLPSPPPPTSSFTSSSAPNQVRHNAPTHVAYLNQEGGSDSEVGPLAGDGTSDGSAISDLPPPPPKPSEKKVVQNIEDLCKLIAKNGNCVEDMAHINESKNPEFAFLYGGEPGSEAEIAHEYFLWMRKKCILAYKTCEWQSGSSLRPLKNESSTQPDHLIVGSGRYSPTDSDMEMEDDFTQSDNDQGFNHSIEIPNNGCDLVPKKLDANEHYLHAPHSLVEGSLMKEASSEKGTCSGPSKIGEEGPHLDNSTLRKPIYDVHIPIVSSAGASEHTIARNLEKSSAPLSNELICPSKTFAAAETIPTDKCFGEPIKGGSPFRLLQGYASDDSSENDDKPHSEDGCPLTLSPSITPLAINSNRDSGYNLGTDVVSKGFYGTEKGFGLHSESSIVHKAPEVTSDSQKVVKDTGTVSISSGTTDEHIDYNHVNQVAISHAASREALLEKDDLGGTSIDVSKGAMSQKKNKEKNMKLESTPLKVDEFGRLVKDDATDSDTDDSRHTRRRSKRGRSRSRSQSPIDRGRRSRPRKRRERRSRSRSWSPRNRRSRSRSPLSWRAGEVSVENMRRQKGHLPECFDFRRGKCYRGASCRYMHHESDRSSGSRYQKSKRQYPEDPPSLRNSNTREDIHKTSANVSNDEREASKSQELHPYQDVHGATKDGNISWKREDILNDAGKSGISDSDGPNFNSNIINHESSRDVAAELWEMQVVQEKQEQQTTNIHDAENSRLTVDSQQPLSVDGFLSQAASDADIPKLQGVQNADRPSQLIHDSSISDSSPGHTSLTSNKFSTSEPLPNMKSSTQPWPDSSSTSRPLSSERSSLQSLAPKESSHSISGMGFSHHPSELHPPPVSQGVNAGHTVQLLKDDLTPQSASFPFESVPGDSFHPYQVPLPKQHSQYSVPPNSSWTSLPPPPPRPLYDSTGDAGTSTPGVSSQFQQSPSLPYSSQASVRIYPSDRAAYIRVSEFPSLQACPPGQGPNQPLPYVEDLGSNPLPKSNHPSQPFGGINLMRENHFPQLPAQDLISSSSFAAGNMLPSARELFKDKMHSFSGDSLPPGELIKSSSQSLPYSQSQQPPYGLKYPATDIILGEPGKTGLVSRYPSDLLGGHQSSQHPEFGGSRISAHHNPYASTFEQPLSSKFSSGVFKQEKDAPYSSKFDSSFKPSHVPVDGLGVGHVRSSQTTFSPSSTKAIGQLLPRSGGDQYDPLFDSIEPASNSFRRDDHGQKPELTGESDSILRFSGTRKLPDVEEKHKEIGAVASTTSLDNDEYGETADAEVGAVENESPSTPINVANVTGGDMEIDQIKSSGKSKKSKDSRSMKLFKIAVADFVKEVLKPSWRQGNMSKEAFKTIVKKTVDKVSGAMKSHKVPKSQAKIDQYIDSSQRKLTKLVMGYVDKYVKV